MDPLTIVLVAVAALLVVGLVVLFRNLGQKDVQIEQVRGELNTARDERDQARKELKELQKKKEKLESENQGLKDDLENAKRELHKTRQEAKAQAGKSSRRESTSHEDKEIMARMAADLERAREEGQGMRDRIRELETERDRRRQAPAPAPVAAPPVVEEAPRTPTPAAPAPTAPAEPDPKLLRQISSLEGQLERTKKDLAEAKDRLRGRDRDLRNARKSSVSNDRAFRVTQGKLQALKEKLAHLEGGAPQEEPPAAS